MCADSTCGAGCSQPFDPVSEIANLALQPFDRRRAGGRCNEQVAHLLCLQSNSLESLRIDRCVGQGVDLAAEGAYFNFQSGGDRSRIVRLERRAKFGRHRLQRREQ